MRYRLRTLLIVLALGPPLLAGVWVSYSTRREAARRYAEWERAERWRIYRVKDDSIRLPKIPPKRTKQQ
jgi:hypothetical protein